MDLETLYDAWQRYKDLLRRCPHHGLPLWLQVQTFYNGVNPSTRQLIDSAAGVTLNNKTPEAAYKFIKEIHEDKANKSSQCFQPRRSNHAIKLGRDVHPVMQCDTNGGGMSNTEYPSYNPGIESEQMNYMELRITLIVTLIIQVGGITPTSHGLGKEIRDNNHSQAFNKTRFQNTETTLRNQQASIQRIKNQLGQLAKLISERPQGSLPSNTETNPKEQLQAITAHDSEGLNEPELRQKKVVEEGTIKVRHDKPKPAITEYQPRVPYPNAMKKDHTDEQFGKFLKLLKKLHVNLPFLEAFSQMPDSRKFLKELLTNKWRLDEGLHVELNALCSAILQNKLPRKLKDPGSFTIPCLIGSLSVDNALADLGASINVMPYKMFKQLGLEKPKQTRMSIQLADKTIRIPRGIIEDVLVRIDKFIFPVDFVILDMDEDNNVTKRSLFKLLTRLGHRVIKETPRNYTIEPNPRPRANKEITHEERRLQIDELDEWETHFKEKLGKHDEPKQLPEPNQFKIEDQVLLDKTDPRIATSDLDTNEKTSFTVLNIFPYETVEVTNPTLGTFKVNAARLKIYSNHRIDSRGEEFQLLKPP
ncbi:Pol polyprotein [Gossypium australe]|uniref:Pol polyprotein n=1 Tax=Gossypium australe TaxID=47621 RepID=A0A5B6X5L3_9ROSI|nr:Pol polyprotein [Gossypium australe]